MNFKTTIESRDVSIYGIDKKFEKLKGLESGSDYEIEPESFIVAWKFEIEARDWGVKDLSWFVTNIEGRFEIVYFDGNGDETIREMVEFEFEAFRDNTDMEADLDNRSISFAAIEIDYSDMSVRVS